ncbi:MAG TPA: hypothetical protein VFX88_07470 [Actinomycetota bacterium]|jgi:hypothetical protein|nr:hypothetical protein [Actinomycetota bacterium]
MSQHSTEPAGAAAYGTEPAYGTEGYTTTTGDGGSTTDQVKEQVRDKTQMAQERARGAMGQARGRISEQVDQRSTQAGERITGTASDVRTIAQELRNQGKEAPANLAEQAASQADRLGDYLKGASGDRILRDAEDFARRQPMLVAAAGLALGFAASRLLKASSSRRYESTYRTYGGGDYDRTYTSPYDTRTYGTGTYGTGTAYDTGVADTAGRYEADVTVVEAYDPDTVQGEPLRDTYDERRS